MPEYDTPPKVVYELGGGLNQGIPPSEIGQNEHPLLQNFYTQGKKLIRRGGIRRVTSAAYAETLNSFFPYRRSTGDWTLIVGALSTIGKLSGAGIVVIPTATGLALVPVLVPFTWFQYNDIVYATRRGDGRLLRITPSLVELAGIPAPAAALAATPSAGGPLAMGDYAAVFTYANSATGAESNPSPKDDVTLGGGSGYVDYNGISVSATPQVDVKRIYRTLVDQVNEYFFVREIPNAATLYWQEGVLPEDMGDPVLFDNNLPPTDLVWATAWNERCFGTDGTDIFFTNLFNMEGWTGLSIPVYRDDGHIIRVLYAFGDRLVIGKTNKVHFLIGTDRSTFRVLTLSDKHGCMSGHSMRAAEGYLFWYGSGRNFYRSDGNNTVGIGDIKIRTLLDAIPDALQDQVSAEVFPAFSQYVASIPQTGYTQNRVVVVYNYRTDSWTTYTHPDMAPQYLAEFFDSTYGRSLYGMQYDGHVYHLYDPTQLTDYGTPIAAKLLTREEDGGSLMAKALRRVHILCSTAAESIALKAYRDGRAVPSASRNVSLSADMAWKPFNLSTLRDPGSTVQLGIEYTGTTAIELESIGLELDLIERFGGQPQ